MNPVRHAGHLLRRAVGSLSTAEPSEQDVESVRSVLLPGEFALWSGMQAMDKRHSIQVWRRFLAAVPAAQRSEQAAALLHDLGKSLSRLGWTARVVATIAGGVTSRMKQYRDHERLGVGMLVGISEDRTLALLAGSVDDEIARLLGWADDL